MLRIGLLSDTHGYWDERYATHFAMCDEIWHAGDIGDASVTDRLAAIKPLRAVVGNIDGMPLRSTYPQKLSFQAEGVSVLLTHIGGRPGNYDRRLQPILSIHPPQLLVCGHSHILRIQYDKTLKMLYINPGAAGRHGWHQVRTLIRFTINQVQIQDLEVIELGERAQPPANSSI